MPGRSPSCFSASRAASAMALIWRGLAPVQITKKSVNPPALRRSSTTMSKAFLSRAASMAVETDLGNRLRRAGVFTAALVVGFAFLVVLCNLLSAPVQPVGHDMPFHLCRYQIADALSVA